MDNSIYHKNNINAYVPISNKNVHTPMQTPLDKKYLNTKLSTLDQDVFDIRGAVPSKEEEIIKYNFSIYELLKNYAKALPVAQKSLQISEYSTVSTQRLKPTINEDVAIKSAEQVTNDPQLQKALKELTEQEAIVVRTKDDATPIMREQFDNILRTENPDNVIVLDINPQINNGMQKSNTLISKWYSEVNDIPNENLITLRTEELRTKALRPEELNSEWKQGSPIAKQIERNIKNVKILSMDKVREILDNIKGLSADEILENYSIQDLSSVVKTINTNIVAPQKQKGYIGALTSQLETITKDKDEVTVVIPDDCSLSGSSMLCDSVKIFDNFIKNNPDKKLHVVFSPLILGNIAQDAFNTFMDKDTPISNMYLRQIHAIKSDGTEAYSGIKNAFERVRNSENITFEVTPNTLKAKHFTDTDYFKNLDDQELKSKLTYIMQGGLDSNSAQFGGFGNCGTLVITPTEEFELDGKTYAGKIPTNSVGYMEIVGHQAGVLNDEVDSKGKGVFTKGTGWGYSRYSEWEELAHPESSKDRIPIYIAPDGTISIRE